MNYDFSTKRHWRRTMWNAIRNRLLVPTKDAVVLYLPGPEDEDRDIAIQKGFTDNNLIGVERDSASLKTLRGKKKLVVRGDILEIAKAVPTSLDVDALFCDFTCGYRSDIFHDLVTLTTTPQYNRCVFALNFLRGREVGKHREQLFALQSMFDSKHRAEQLAIQVAAYWAVVTARNVKGLPLTDIEDGKPFLQDVLKRMNGEVFYYRSTSNQTFDSSVWVHPYRQQDPVVLKSRQANSIAQHVRAATSKAARGSLAAVLAHRTMRGSIRRA